jgi:hypothetical protein
MNCKGRDSRLGERLTSLLAGRFLFEWMIDFDSESFGVMRDGVETGAVKRWEAECWRVVATEEPFSK